MESFELVVTETLKKIIDVEAETLEDAIQEAYDAFGQGNIELDNDDFNGVDIESAN